MKGGIWMQGRRQKNFQDGATKRRPKNNKKDRQIALLSLFLGGPTEKRPKNSKKRTKNSTF